MQRLRHLREADSTNVCERVEQLPQRNPWDLAGRVRQRCVRVDLAQGAFDLAAAFENCRDLAGRDAGSAAVRQPQVTLAERSWFRGIVGFIARIRLEELERKLQWILDRDTTTKNDRPRAAHDLIISKGGAG